MLKHHLLLAFRNFLRYKSSFLINLVGLSTGLACVLLIYLWVDDELHMDKFHEKDASLYQAMEHQKYAEEIMTTTSTPGILAEALAEEIPEIEYAATATWVSDFTLSIGEKNVGAKGYYVGKDYFNIFSLGLIHGDANHVLLDKNSMVISSELSAKLFETTEGVIGKEVQLQHDKTFLVSGVFEGTPRQSSIQFDFVLSIELFKDENQWANSWGNNGPSTFAVLIEGADVDEVNYKIEDFIQKKNEQSNVRLFLMPYSERYLYGRFRDGKPAGGRIEYVRLFSIIAIFILVIACINFMNLSTARATRRAKEVGIKKAVGAYKGTLVSQFLTESILITFISLLTAIVIVKLILPQFNIITEKQIELIITPTLILWALAITLFTGLVSGSYPAFYLSGFKPVKVLKGDVKGTLGELWARRGLVIFQFAMSTILIFCVLVVYNQIQYVQNKNLGYNKDNIIFFQMEGRVESNRETFLSEVRKLPNIVSAATIGHNLLGRQNNTSGLEWDGYNPEEKILFENMRVGYDLIETLGIEMKEGRSFSRDFATDPIKIILNEAAIRTMNYENPVGRTMKLWGKEREIIGVVKDFHYQSLHSEVKPLFFILAPEVTWYIMVRIEAGTEKTTLNQLAGFYNEFNPGFTFDYEFLDQSYAGMYIAEQRVASLSQYFAGFAILISCLGLFGLAAFTAQRRLKEIGIRKAMGSSVSSIVLLLSKDFTQLVGISIVVALPVSYFLMSMWLSRFAFKIELSWIYFVGSGLIAILISWLTISIQSFKAARVSPTQCLRNE
jgi:predicted permease